MSQRSGVLIYLDCHASIETLTDEESGKLFKAILDYVEYGVIPDFADNKALLIIWGLMRPKIDLDGVKYDNTCKNKKYSAFCRDYKAATGLEPPPRVVWETAYLGLSYKEYIEHEARQQNSPPTQNEPVNSQNASTQIPDNQCEFEDYTKQSDADFEKLRESQLQLLNANRAQNQRNMI